MRRRTLLAAAPLLLVGCGAGLFQVLDGISKGASFLSSALDTAEQGSANWFAKHPSPRQDEVDKVLLAARAAADVLDEAIATAKAADDDDLSEARSGAKRTYRDLVTLLDVIGIPQAAIPDGGAESSAEPPEPFDLPSADEMAARL